MHDSFKTQDINHILYVKFHLQEISKIGKSIKDKVHYWLSRAGEYKGKL